MSDKAIIIYKKAGQKPLDCIVELKKSRQEWKYLPMTYAGRLDPLAEGVLLLLVGDECLKKDEYLALPKEYEVDVLFGFETDTYDVLGKVVASPEEVFERSSDLLDKFLKGRGQTVSNTSYGFAEEALSQFTGKITQVYPQYSSRTVEGKPLYQWARAGKINEIEIPKHNVLVESIEILNTGEITGEDLLIKIIDDIGKVSGDFRQEEILTLWNKVLKDKKEIKYQTVKFKIVCGSGFYVRVFAHDLGKALGTSALALKIIRTRIGEYIC